MFIRPHTVAAVAVAFGQSNIPLATHRIEVGGQGVGLVLHGGAATRREIAVGPGVASWRRSDLAIGPSYQLSRKGWRWLGSVGASIGWLSASGRNFPENRSGTAFSPGASGLLRLSYQSGNWSPWLALVGGAAFHPKPLVVVGSAEQRSLRPMETGLCLGLSWGTDRR